MKWLIYLLLTVSLLVASVANSTIYFSEDFDDWDDWDGGDDGMDYAEEFNFFNNSTSQWPYMAVNGDLDDAHGSTGKSAIITWPDLQREVGFSTYTGSYTHLYIGFWFKHNANFNVSDSHKWIYFPEVSGNRTMLSLNNSTIGFFNGSSYSCEVSTGTASDEHPSTSSSDWYNDTTWHSYIIYAHPGNSDIRIWRDGTELDWECNNLSVSFGGTSFDSDWMSWGYQSRSYFSSNISYYDDIIRASTMAEVEDFLGESASSSTTGTKFNVSYK